MCRRIIEGVWTEENFEVIDEPVADDRVFHDAFAVERIRGLDGMHEYFETLAPIIDDRISTGRLLAKDDRIVSRFVVRGTHVGEFSGIEPTRRSRSCGSS